MNSAIRLTASLHRNRQAHASKTALVCGPVRRTHADLHARAGRLAAALRRLGVAPGDRIAILSLNSAECIELWFAAWWIGAVACPLNTRHSAAELAFAVDDCGAAVMAVDDTHAAQALALREGGTSLRTVLRLSARSDGAPETIEALIAGHEPVSDGGHGDDALAALIYTGGTTGRAKGVMLSHRNLWTAAMSRLADNPPFRDTVTLVSTPLFHVAGISRVLPHLLAGGCCVIVPQFRAPDVLALIRDEGITDLPLVPSMLRTVLDHPDFSVDDVRSLRRIFYGAAPSSGALLQRVMRQLPWVGLLQAYGMTESSAVGTLSEPADHAGEAWETGRALSAGRACTGIELRVVDDQGRDCRPGEVGEIVLRGPTVSPGYWRRPEETAATFRDGWLHTGDAGRLDGAGYLSVVDRLKDMIVTGGENVYSAEVENALAAHAAVAACAVIGVPSDLWGEAVHAIVVLAPGRSADEADLRAHCQALLANYKCPKRIDFAAALPLTAAGKVAKNVLREGYRAPLPPRAN